MSMNAFGRPRARPSPAKCCNSIATDNGKNSCMISEVRNLTVVTDYVQSPKDLFLIS